MSARALPVIEHCWRVIGVQGDRSCPELTEHIHCRNCPVFSAAGQRLYDRPPPEGYTDEWTERIAAAEDRDGAKSMPVILFRVSAEWLALDVKLAVEVSPIKTVRRVPHQTDDLLAGLVNIRGELQPAISLSVLLGIDVQAEKPGAAVHRRLLVAERNNARWVFLVDEVDDVFHFSPNDLGALPGTVATGSLLYTRGIFRKDDRAIGYLDPDRIFAALKRQFR